MSNYFAKVIMYKFLLLLCASFIISSSFSIAQLTKIVGRAGYIRNLQTTTFSTFSAEKKEIYCPGESTSMMVFESETGFLKYIYQQDTIQSYEQDFIGNIVVMDNLGWYMNRNLELRDLSTHALIRQYQAPFSLSKKENIEFVYNQAHNIICFRPTVEKNQVNEYPIYLIHPNEEGIDSLVVENGINSFDTKLNSNIIVYTDQIGNAYSYSWTDQETTEISWIEFPKKEIILSDDSKILCTRNKKNGTIFIYDFETKEQKESIPFSMPQSIMSMDISKDNKYLVFHQMNFIYNYEIGSQIFTPETFPMGVAKVQYMDENRILVEGSDRNTLTCIFDLTDRTIIPLSTTQFAPTFGLCINDQIFTLGSYHEKKILSCRNLNSGKSIWIKADEYILSDFSGYLLVVHI